MGLRYISDAVIERLETGQFTPERKSRVGNTHLADRRNVLSPLSVTKRCVKYDHHVFVNRTDIVLQLAKDLNQPAKKMILIEGLQGMGKTSLARGLIEIMGGGNEQLLWFDVTAHTDFDDVILFLIQYITYICSALNIDNSKGTSVDENIGDPFERLEQLIDQVSDVPLLVVIDNVEHLVSEDGQINSPYLKETLNFLLAFPNIKLVLVGERLPHADLGGHPEVMTHITLAGVPIERGFELIRLPMHSAQDQAEAEWLYDQVGGAPWLLKLLYMLDRSLNTELSVAFQNTEQFVAALKAQPQSDKGTIPALLGYTLSQLSDDVRHMGQVLAFLRHPADVDALIEIGRYALPALSENVAYTDPKTLRMLLDQSLMVPLLRRTFPPQEVLSHVRDRHETQRAFRPWYELYDLAKIALYDELATSDRANIHHHLATFYQDEKKKNLGQRIYKTKLTILSTASRYHQEQADAMRNIFGSDTTPSSPDPMLAASSAMYSSLTPPRAETVETTENPPDVMRADREPESIVDVVPDISPEDSFPEALSLTETEKQSLEPLSVLEHTEPPNRQPKPVPQVVETRVVEERIVERVVPAATVPPIGSSSSAVSPKVSSVDVSRPQVSPSIVSEPLPPMDIPQLREAIINLKLSAQWADAYTHVMQLSTKASEEGDFATAKRACYEALSLAKRMGSPQERGTVYMKMADLSVAQGDKAKAAQYRQLASQFVEAVG